MTKFKNSFKVAVISSVAVLGFISAPAQAQDMQFKFDRTELQSSTGTQKVFKRLKRTVKKACTPSGRLTLRGVKETEECRAEMLNMFVEKINHTRLTALYDGEMEQTLIASN